MASEIWESYWKDHNNREWWKKPAPEVLDLIRSLSPADRPKVLDLGCGLGRHAIAFAFARFKVSATDASAEAIRYLNEWAQKLQLSIETKVCEMLDSTFPAESFDVVLGYNVIYHGSREQFARAIQHVRNLLRPNGIFFSPVPVGRMGNTVSERK